MKSHVEVDLELQTFLTQQYMHLSDFLHPRPLYLLPKMNDGHSRGEIGAIFGASD